MDNRDLLFKQREHIRMYSEATGTITKWFYAAGKRVYPRKFVANKEQIPPFHTVSQLKNVINHAFADDVDLVGSAQN